VRPLSRVTKFWECLPLGHLNIKIWDLYTLFPFPNLLILLVYKNILKNIKKTLDKLDAHVILDNRDIKIIGGAK
jgi:hypothetical protein